jgi:sugar-specific transcriptional regulator TrmB
MSAENVSENIVSKLNSVIQEITDEIAICDTEITKITKEYKEKVENLEERKKELQRKIQEGLTEIQSKFSIKSKKLQRKQKNITKENENKDQTIPDLILQYLGEHKQAKSSEIRKFLIEHGRKSNPGVALGRLVKNGSIKNVERGIYSLS